MFNVVRQDYSASAIPEQKKVLESFFDASKPPESKIDADVIKRNLKTMADQLESRMRDAGKEDSLAKAHQYLNSKLNTSTTNPNVSMLQRLNDFSHSKLKRKTEFMSGRLLSLAKSPQMSDKLRQSSTDDRAGSIADLNLDSSATKQSVNGMYKVADVDQEPDYNLIDSSRAVSNKLMGVNAANMVNLYNNPANSRVPGRQLASQDYYNTTRLDMTSKLME